MKLQITLKVNKREEQVLVEPWWTLAKVLRDQIGLKGTKIGCGSGECGCGHTHSIPFKIDGKCGSVRIRLIPAPAGVGLACADKVKQVLKLAGIEDIWSKTFGDTRTSENLVKATFNALKNAHKYNFNL